MTRGLIALLLVPGCIYVEKDDDSSTDTGLTTGAPAGVPGGTAGATTTDPDADNDGFPASMDCDDTNAAINPDALEACDGIDNNCDDGVDDAAAATLDGANYATLDELWAVVTNGSVAMVCSGTWPVTLPMLDAGAVTLTSVGGRDVTTISEVAGGPAFFVTGSGSLTLDGFTITGSTAQALDIDEGGSLSLLNSRVTANGQGVSIYAGTNGVTPSLTIDGCDLDANANPGGQGGAVRAEFGANVSIANSNLTGNSADYGGAVWASATFVPMTIAITDSLIDGNTADWGGGLSLTNVALDATGTTISTNLGVVAGGGVDLVEASISGASILDNESAAGGGVATRYNAIFLGNPFDPDLTGVVIEGNAAQLGAGVFVDEQTTVTLDATSSLRLNVAAISGGGVWLDAATAHVVSEGAETGSYATYDDNLPDDVASGAGMTLWFDGTAPFDCLGTGACI